MENKFNEDFLKADELIKDNKISEALGLLQSIILEEPSFGKAHNHIGWIYETKLGEHNKAELHYKQAIKSEPTYHASYVNYAYLLSGQNRFEELKKHLEHCLNVHTINKSTIYNEYGIMYELQGNNKEAVKAFKKAKQYCLDIKTMETYDTSIQRCIKKAGFLKSLFW
ncbi:MAG: hypothetical protein JNM51_11440 [Bacteroidia bacterium]|nr:hypothetical protein [Bacteroidia bacterium]